MRGRSTRFFRFMVWLLVCTFFLPAPLAVNAAPSPSASGLSGDVQPWNRHVHERWNSPERAAAIEEAARIEAAAREDFARNQAAAPSTTPADFTPERPSASIGRHSREGGNPASSALAASGEKALAPRLRGGDGAMGGGTESRPQSVTEVLFNYAAGFVGVPGLAPRQSVDGSLDEGLGFHQDGTARRAGGVAGTSGPSDRGQRSRAYMQSGLQSGYGMNVYGAGFGAGYGGLYDEMHYDLWGRNDSTRGGRIGAGNGYSRDLGDFDPMGMALDRGLNWGAGFVNSMGEAAISGLVDGGRARLNFRLDRDGYFNGEGDALLPFYDGKYTTVYTQLGARSMHDCDDTRWIGNFGLGQRWFPFAEGDDPKSGGYDAGNLMLGYNAFFDYDFTRDHQRGGFGVEAQYDWLRVASNYYFPLSDWRGSEDFDSRFVKERPAEGWDVRAKGYLPFYRNVAVTGAYSQWYGDHVGMFGAEHLEKDPKVWSYGLEYTPVPLVSGFVTQKSTERGRSDTEFGLTFTYHFGMSWEDQTSHRKVAELRTVGGSRHEFVDRENRIILEYKAKNSYRIEYLGPDGARGFKFRILNGFDEFMAGQVVRVTASGGAYLAQAGAGAAPAEPQGFFAQAAHFLDELISVKTAYAADFSKTYTTDGQGYFWVQLEASAPANTSVTVQAGNNSQTFTLAGGGGAATGSISVNVGTFSGGVSTATLTLNATDSQGNAVSGENVTWTVTASSGNAAAVTSAFKPTLYGLQLENLGRIMPSSYASVDTGDYTGKVSAVKDIGQSVSLSDIVGQRTVTVTAEVTIDGSPQTFTTTMQFGNGPLYDLRLTPSGAVGAGTWTQAADACGGSGYTLPSSWNSGTGYVANSNLPYRSELQAVSGSTGNSAWEAAGWPGGLFWTGEAYEADGAFFVLVDGGVDYPDFVGVYFSFVCRR